MRGIAGARPTNCAAGRGADLRAAKVASVDGFGDADLHFTLDILGPDACTSTHDACQACTGPMTDSYPALIPPNNVQSVARKAGPSLKRKRGGDLDHGLWAKDVDILSEDGSAGSVQSLKPLCMITRAQLPLSFLDPSTLICRRFKANADILQPSSGPYALLIARAADGGLSAIEKIKDSQYAVCKLAAHITLETIKACQTHSVDPIDAVPVQPGGDWRSAAAIESPLTGMVSRPRKVPRLSMIPGLRKEEKQSTIEPMVAEMVTTTPLDQNAIADGPLVQGESTPDEAFATFIRQYLDMLYNSRASVAYFAKAHVSRLKASIGLDGEDGKQVLHEFLEGLVLSSTAADKKHKKIWPEKLQELPTLSLEPGKASASKPAKRRKTKNKLDKQGLLLGEEESFLHWWVHSDEAGTPNESHAARLKRRSLQLRTREAFLQIIILLELLSMNAVNDTSSVKAGKAATVKPKNFQLALDLLLDKLCIWHSVEHGSEVGTGGGGEQDGQKRARDQLREFCVEVIVPFYMSKAPEQAKAVNKKLGGPGATTPAARHRSNHFDHHHVAKPASDGSRRTSTDKTSRPKQGPAKLTRHGSDSQRIKRESSTTSFDTIPLAQTNKENANIRRSNTMDKMKMKQREVDFDALSQAQEQRRKKQAEVDSKLKEAIYALKKPNRALAGKELADVAEQRERMAQARDRASKGHKARHKSSIQVDATPKKNRTRTDIVVTPEAPRRTEPVPIASGSTVSRVPSSGVRHVDDAVPHTGHRDRQHAVDATPVRTINFAMPSLPPPRPPVFQTPVKARPPVFETPIKDKPDDDDFTIMQTPVQATAAEKEVAETPRGAVPGRSIYEALGWNE